MTGQDLLNNLQRLTVEQLALDVVIQDREGVCLVLEVI